MAGIAPPRALAEQDDRSGFDCGRDSLNLWFRRHAWSNHVNGLSRVNVLTDTASQRIVGYVTLSAAHIERAFFPKAQQRNTPNSVPVTLLGQLAVDKDYQRRGHAASLLLFEFGRRDPSVERGRSRLLSRMGFRGITFRPGQSHVRPHGRPAKSRLKQGPRRPQILNYGRIARR